MSYIVLGSKANLVKGVDLYVEEILSSNLELVSTECNYACAHCETHFHMND